MKTSITLRDEARELELLQARVLVAAILVVAALGLLVSRLYHLQVVNHAHFATLSEDNRVKLVPVPPTRGLIYDRNGVVLAHNVPSFSLELVPEAVPDLQATLAALAQIIEVGEADLDRFHRARRRARPFEGVPLRFHLSEEEVARFALDRYRFPGVDIEARLTRHYPLGPTMVHVTGYVGRIDEQDLQNLDVTNYRGTSHVGKTGVEKAYEDVLHGRVGYEHVESNAQGRRLRVLERTPSTPGQDVHLALDTSLQLVAQQALGEENGAVVALDPRSGAVLALVSTPVYDPNPFVNGIAPRLYQSLQKSRDRPLFNRALRGQYPPGSTIKQFVALGGLAYDLPLSRGATFCRGWFSLPGQQHRYRDWKKEGHGRVDLHLSIVRSCDVYYYELAHAMGINRMHDFLVQFGFGRRTGIDIGGDLPGVMPSTEWKQSARKQRWYPGETVIAGIGQGFMLATPIQLAAATGTLANRGRRLQPRVALAFSDPVSGTRSALAPVSMPAVQPLPDTHWDRVIRAMEDVVHSPGGTAHRVSLGAAYRMAGKTGTAQVFSLRQDQKYDAKKIDKRLRDHALFVAFAPVDNPRIAVAVLVENGGSGSGTAAPIARKVLDHYLLGAVETEPTRLAMDPAGALEGVE